jgi:predicted ATPase
MTVARSTKALARSDCTREDRLLLSPPPGGTGPAEDALMRVELVGRTHELSVLHARRAGLARRPSLVMLTGEPGIGKTRLAETFAEQAEAGGARAGNREDHRDVSGTAPPVEPPTSKRPWSPAKTRRSTGLFQHASSG